MDVTTVRDIEVQLYVADNQICVRAHAWRDGKLYPFTEYIDLGPIVEAVCAGVDRLYANVFSAPQR